MTQPQSEPNHSTSAFEPLRILMLTSSYPKYPGDVTAPFIEAIAQYSQKLGHSVTVIMPQNPQLRRQPVENGVRLLTYNYMPVKKWQIWGYAASLQGDVKVRGLIYLLLPFVLLTSFWKMWRETGRNRYDLIQAHWVIPNAPVAVLVGLLRRIPVVISLHGSDVYIAEKIKPVGWVARWAFKRAKAVTASSGDLMTRAQKLGAPTDPAASRVIPYGAEPATFAAPSAPREELRAQFGFGPDDFMLLCVGRLVYKKGFEYAIRAMPSVLTAFPTARLVIAGAGDLRQELETLAQSLGLGDRVRFEGSVSHNRIPDYLAACDIFLLPSVVDRGGNVDGLPNTLLEAMAAGRAVIASNLAGVPLAVIDDESGQLVPPTDSAALAAAIKQLLADPSRRASYGQAASQRIHDYLTWDKIAAQYSQVFKASFQRRDAETQRNTE